MTEPVDFLSRLAAKRAATGASDFMLCACQEGVAHPTGYFPVVQHDASGGFISALVCESCQGEVYLVNGRLP